MPPEPANADSDFGFRIGQISGQVAALQSRMDRSENEMSTRLDRIDSKLDLLMQGQAVNMGSGTERSEMAKQRQWTIGTFLALLMVGISFVGVALAHHLRLNYD